MEEINEIQTEGVAEQTENEGTVKKKNGFSSKLGFVLAAAGSAVGLGNLWRFPYLAAKYGGGFFLLCYILLAVTFGFTLLVLEIAIGRKTGKGVIGAFKSLNSKFKWFGYVCVIVPLIIVPYYCVIGGWVLKYVFSFAVGSEGLVAGSGAVNTANFFSVFIGDTWQPLIFFLIFALLTVGIVAFGVQKGIEKVSKILMPLLAVMSIFLMIYVLCQPGAWEGVKYFIVPNFEGMTAEKVFKTVLSALGQLFYSMSLAMCIMITYGSYMKKSDNIRNCARQISICDTAFAVVAALIIIPAIFAFSSDPQSVLNSSGPSLMFIQLPEIFNQIIGGRIIGVVFFILVLFAALTSSISLVEAIIAVLTENGRMKRVTACIIVFSAILVLGTLSSLGNGVLSNVSVNIKGQTMGILDMFDFLANNILMPIVSIITCVIAGWFIDKNVLPEEIGIDKNRKKLNYFNVMIKYIAPICILAILVSGLLLTF